MSSDDQLPFSVDDESTAAAPAQGTAGLRLVVQTQGLPQISVAPPPRPTGTAPPPARAPESAPPPAQDVPPAQPEAARPQDAAAEPAAAQVVEPTQLGSTLILGASQAGKTSLLAALQQACNQPEEDEPYLGFIPEGETLTLRRSVLERLAQQKPLEATGSVQSYPFQINLARLQPASRWRKVQQQLGRLRGRLGLAEPPPALRDAQPGERPTHYDRQISFVMHDGPGEAFFPNHKVSAAGQDPQSIDSSWERLLVPAGQEADNIILCVDASTIPQDNRLSIHLPDFLSKLCGDGRKVLRARRFLILLTKIDLLCLRLWEGLPPEEKTLPFLHGRQVPTLTPHHIAQWIDPVAQARELMTPELLKEILDRLDPQRSTLAVGICSAWGFRAESGQPFFQDNAPTFYSANTATDVIRYWRPFGIKEAIRFVADGELGPLVQPLRLTDLFHRESFNVEIPLSQTEAQ